METIFQLLNLDKADIFGRILLGFNILADNHIKVTPSQCLKYIFLKEFASRFDFVLIVDKLYFEGDEPEDKFKGTYYEQNYLYTSLNYNNGDFYNSFTGNNSVIVNNADLFLQTFIDPKYKTSDNVVYWISAGSVFMLATLSISIVELKNILDSTHADIIIKELCQVCYFVLIAGHDGDDMQIYSKYKEPIDEYMNVKQVVEEKAMSSDWYKENEGKFVWSEDFYYMKIVK